MVAPITGGGKLEKCAAAAWEEMVIAAQAEGIVLKPTSAGDTLRSIAQQTAGFTSRYQKEPIAGASTKKWNNETWYLKKGMAMLATPYDDPANDKARGSRHLYGIAVDVANANGKILAWLLENEVKFGFSHEVLGDSTGKGAEPWHIRFVGKPA
jgi:LAS superfamily LD-carboxypeptidase LdcB